MQYRQPMQRPWSTSTMPFGADVGGAGRQTLAHGASSPVHALQRHVLDAHARILADLALLERMNESVGSKPFWRWHAVRQA